MSYENLNPLLKAFQEQKVSKQNTELLAAQRFVNQYRSLYCFKPEFADEFNRSLLAATVEEKRLLSTLMGGNEVRSYLDFLQQQSHHEQNLNDQQKNHDKGYLPMPEEDEIPSESENTVRISMEEWQKMKEQQKLLMEQTQLLAHSLKNTSGQFKNLETSQPEVSQNYSDIIEDEG